MKLLPYFTILVLYSIFHSTIFFFYYISIFLINLINTVFMFFCFPITHFLEMLPTICQILKTNFVVKKKIIDFVFLFSFLIWPKF